MSPNGQTPVEPMTKTYTLQEAAPLIPLTWSGLQAYLLRTGRTWDRLTQRQIDEIRDVFRLGYASP